MLRCSIYKVPALSFTHFFRSRACLFYHIRLRLSRTFFDFFQAPSSSSFAVTSEQLSYSTIPSRFCQVPFSDFFHFRLCTFQWEPFGFEQLVYSSIIFRKCQYFFSFILNFFFIAFSSHFFPFMLYFIYLKELPLVLCLSILKRRFL